MLSAKLILLVISLNILVRDFIQVFFYFYGEEEFKPIFITPLEMALVMLSLLAL